MMNHVNDESCKQCKQSILQNSSTAEQIKEFRFTFCFYVSRDNHKNIKIF